MMQRQRRILKELSNLREAMPENVELLFDESVLTTDFRGFFIGPSNSPYEGGLFAFSMSLPTDYPMTPPQVKFLTKICHPNISAKGDVCADVLSDKWSPSLTIKYVLREIGRVMSEPNFDQIVNQEAGDAEAAGMFLQTAEEATLTYAH